MFEIHKKTLRRIFLGVISCIFVYWLLHEPIRVRAFFGAVSGVLTPFILGGVLAFILNVPMRAMENGFLKKIKKHSLRRTLAMVLTFIAILLVVASVFLLLIPQIVNTVKSLVPSLTDFYTDARSWVVELLDDHPELKDWLIKNTELENTSWDTQIQNILSSVGNSIGTIVGGAVSAVGSVFTAIFNLVIGVVFSIYCLAQKETLARQGRKLLYAFLKEKNADYIIRVLRLTNSTFSNFLSGQCVEVCILGFMFAISMAIFRMPFIPLISVLIAVTAFIPIVGAWTGCVLGAFFILVEDPVLAFWFIILFVVIQQIENNMIYPKVVGSSVGLSGMWVLLAVAIGGELMGVAGMFLMIPLVSVLYTLIQEFTHKKLAGREIDQQKLEPQSPELYSRFRARRETKKKTKLSKKNANNGSEK